MTTYEVIGVGLGPFNLGLAALLDPVDDVDAVFFDAAPSFAWHPGLMLPGTTLQVPFLADLVTLTDPTSRYSFLSYLHEHNRLYRFYFYERFHIPRREYDAYARWVTERLPSCRFGHQVERVEPADDGTWIIHVRSTGRADEISTYRARAVVFGVGSRPSVPGVVRDKLGDDVFHAADYLMLREKARGAEAVTVVGSGQSAGEVVADLLESGLPAGQRLDWFTRGAGFLPMEYSKLGLEHFTPEYTAYFHGLPAATRDRVRAGQDLLYKGLSAETSERIYDLLYEATIDRADPPVTYASGCELMAIEPSPVPGRRWRLTWRHKDEGTVFTRDTDVVILATGYEPAPLPLPDGLIARDEQGRPLVSADYQLSLANHDDAPREGSVRRGEPVPNVGPSHQPRAAAPPPTASPSHQPPGAAPLDTSPSRQPPRDPSSSGLFVQNAELHTHGVGAPDLGLGAHRNSVIVNALAGREVYPVRDRTVFQRFGTPTAGPTE